MKVLLVHNRYRTSAPSGEDVVVRLEREMLTRRGVTVVPFDRCNDDVDDSTLGARIGAAINTVWSASSRRALESVLRDEKPDVAHVHNTFSIISPSIYGACRAAGVPVVQTLHNFRLFCPSALFLRDGRPCEECVDHGLLRSIRYRCYRGSLPATATMAGMLSMHRTIGTYSRDIDRFIALTEFARGKVVRAGLDPGRVAVKPNFLPEPPARGAGGGGYAVYAGRLTAEKGVRTLLEAWKALPDIPLRILGEGALRASLEQVAVRDRVNVQFLGQRPRSEVLEVLRGAEFLVVPSECYEGFPMIIAEAYACGTPVLVSCGGSMDELVKPGVTGETFAARDANELAASARRLHVATREGSSMRDAARSYFDSHLTEEQNFATLMRVYESALGYRGRGVRAATPA